MSGIGSCNSYCGCERCQDVGVPLDRCIRFTSLNAPPRVDEEWESYGQGPPPVHCRRPTPLNDHPVVPPVSKFISHFAPFDILVSLDFQHFINFLSGFWRAT